MNREKEIKFLPKDISKCPLVRVIGKNGIYLYQVKLPDGRVATYCKPFKAKNYKSV